MENVEKLLANIEWTAVMLVCTRILLIIVVAWIGAKLLKKGLQRFQTTLIARAIARGESARESEKRIETITRLLKQLALLTIWVTTILVILREIGVEVGPLIASAGIVGLAVGFGAQNLVRDFISGFFMILEDQIRVGDVAIINGTGGLVESINFRTTVLRDVAGVVHYFPNGMITSLSNRTNDWSAYVFDIGVAYKENTDQVTAIIQQVIDEMKQDEVYGELIVDEPEIFGVDQLADSAVVIKGRIKTKPVKQWEVGRQFLRRIKLAFDEQGIEIPFPHRTMYFGEVSKPFDVQVLEKLKPSENKEAD